MGQKSQDTFIPEPHWLLFNRRLNRSPRIRTLTFSAQRRHLLYPLNHLVSSSGANSPSGQASYDVLVHSLADLLQASFPPFLTDWHLPFTSSYGHNIPRLFRVMTVIFLQRTFTSLVNAHVGRTPANSAEAKRRPADLDVGLYYL